MSTFINDAYVHELHAMTAAGRIAWNYPIAEALARAGLQDTLLEADWAASPWYGPIEPFLHGEQGRGVSDLLINAPNTPLLVLRDRAREQSAISPHIEWVEFLQRQLLVRSGIVSLGNSTLWPAHQVIGTADRRLRYALTRPPLSPLGPTVSIRILPPTWPTMAQLVSSGVVDPAAADMLLQALHGSASLLVAGATGSGKTTLVAALLQAIGDEQRLIMIEEASELPQLADSLHLEVTRSGLTFSDCVYLSLRMKPHRIVLGELRGPEALAMLQAGATAHPSVATIHAEDVKGALDNLTRMALESGMRLEVIRGMLSSGSLELIVVHIGRYGGRRRVGQIEEMLRGTSGDRYTTQTLFAFNSRTNRIEPTGYTPAGTWAR